LLDSLLQETKQSFEIIIIMIKSQLSGTGLQNLWSVQNISTVFRHLSVSTSVQQPQKAITEIPKRPPTPWITYYTKHFPAFKKSYPSSNNPELMKKINNEWGKLAQNEKEKMQKVYLNEMAVYKKKMEKVPQQMLDEMKAAKVAKQEEKKSRKAKKETKDFLNSLNKPKRPLNAYLLYTQDRRPQLPSTMTSADKLVKMGKEWKEANKQLKDFYEKKQVELAKKYEKDLERWNMKMQKDGKLVEIADAEKRLKRQA